MNSCRLFITIVQLTDQEIRYSDGEIAFRYTGTFSVVIGKSL
jgi:hypothetical protein